jgi:hypothetical protein
MILATMPLHATCAFPTAHERGIVGVERGFNIWVFQSPRLEHSKVHEDQNTESLWD